ncbi:hypothetical protein [Phaeodactylibacter xiamenensis]|uniref:hypothetical protein n=1 Tax=Phaeodactylibacter xiamenensis TaxID=1524460 RepID=UPI0024A98361|nr:hypothetical protein [Phaeodactylibacter xiamenensis]
MSKKQRKPKHFLFCFRPKEYTGAQAAQVAHLPENERPLLRFPMEKAERGYILARRYSPLWAAIIDKRDKSAYVDEYSHERGWASGQR